MSNPAGSPSEVVIKEALRRHVASTINLPPHASFMRILGVNYVHLKTSDEGDLYLTEYGLPYLKHLQPENWYEDEWFKKHRERLEGTSVIYKVPTRPIEGALRKSIDIVVKWSRVGQDVPLDTFTLQKAINAEFNTPFEEFSLLEDLREGNYGPKNLKILTQKPLAIYVPPEQMQLWQTGRSKSKILAKVARHPGIEIDILRSYILLYAWIRGLNTLEAYRASYYEPSVQQQKSLALTHQVHAELEKKGFVVADHKPTHVICRMHNGDLRRRKDGNIMYAVIDYELLARTPEHEEIVRATRRSEYLTRQRDRFLPRDPSSYPPHIRPARILGVDYVCGRTESTNGLLWVVGNDPDLFNYFLPERWRTKQVQLSLNQTYYTQTKDRIHLVWKVSRVGELPSGDVSDPATRPLLLHGFNSPFEEVAMALEMNKRGVPTVYPRAIYMTALYSGVIVHVLDDRRFEKYKNLKAPDGQPAFPMDHDYITIWGYWRGLDDGEAANEVGYWNPIDAAQAARIGLITPEELEQLIERQRARLAAAGFEDLMMSGTHLILSYVPPSTLKRDANGDIMVRHCNLEMVRRI